MLQSNEWETRKTINHLYVQFADVIDEKIEPCPRASTYFCDAGPFRQAWNELYRWCVFISRVIHDCGQIIIVAIKYTPVKRFRIDTISAHGPVYNKRTKP